MTAAVAAAEATGARAAEMAVPASVALAAAAAGLESRRARTTRHPTAGLSPVKSALNQLFRAGSPGPEPHSFQKTRKRRETRFERAKHRKENDNRLSAPNPRSARKQSPPKNIPALAGEIQRRQATQVEGPGISREAVRGVSAATICGAKVPTILDPNKDQFGKRRLNHLAQTDDQPSEAMKNLERWTVSKEKLLGPSSESSEW